MPPTNPRIIVVDDNKGLYNIVRASLELLGRRPRLIETHTGDDALMEIRVSSPDLLISAHTLVGTTNGPMLALMAKRELAALPIIVMGNETDPEIDEDTLTQSPFQYLRRPVAPEIFLRTLRVALDGAAAVPETAKPEEDMGPVPVVDGDKLRPILFKLMRDVGAMAAVLADRNGKVINYEGAAGYIDREALATALGPGFAATTKILNVIGEQPRVLKHFDGEKGDLFGLAVGFHYFLILVFDGNAPASALGNVKRFGGIAVNEMLEIISSPVAFSVKPAAPPSPPTPTPVPAATAHTGRRSRRTQEISALPVAEAPKPVPAKKKTEPVAIPKQPAMEPITNFDPSLLDALSNIDLSKADEMFSPDALAATATAGGNRISFEDALMQGIIGDVDE